MELHAPLTAQQQRAQGGAVTGGSQRACIAVGQDPGAVRQQGKAVFCNFITHGSIFVIDSLGFPGQCSKKGTVFPMEAAGNGIHTPAGPAKIYRSGAGSAQPSGKCSKGREKIFFGKLPGQRSQRVRGKYPDSRCSPYAQVLDRLKHGLFFPQFQVRQSARQLCLVQNDNAISVRTGADIDKCFHKNTTFSTG